MKNKAMKLLAMLLALSMVVSLTGITVLAQEALEEDALEEVLTEEEELPDGGEPAAATLDEVLDEAFAVEPADEAPAALSEEPSVAQVGGVGYATLEDAIAACDLGGTVTLLQDLSLRSLYPSVGGITLDLGGNTLTFTQNGGGLWCDGTITIQNGAVEAVSRCQCPLNVSEGGNMELKDVTVTGTSVGVTISGNGMLTVGNNVTIEGTNDAGISIQGGNSDNLLPDENDCARLTVNGANSTITGGACGIAGTATKDGTVIHLIAGTVTGEAGVGVFHPQQGSLTIEEGMTITGKVGVQIMGGELTINGGDITATDPETYSAPRKVNGYYLDGAAVSVITDTGEDKYGNKPFGDVSVVIQDGVFTAQTGNPAAHLYNIANQTEGPAEGASLVIEGGRFSSRLDDCYLNGAAQDEEGNVVGCLHSDAFLVDDETIPATCVSGGKNVYQCRTCGTKWEEKTGIDPMAHDYVSHDQKAATCTEIGWAAYETCTRCDYTTYREIPATNHSIETVSGRVEPTCTTPGRTASTRCTNCGGTWGGEIIPARGHTPVSDDNAVAPTCQHTGLTASTSCSVCHTRLTEQRVLAVTDHAPVADEAVAPTCTTTGLTAGSHCRDCGAILVAQETVPMVGHSIETIPGYAPTCTTPGLTDGRQCAVCHAVLTERQPIRPVGHTVVTDPAKDPTCTETGLTEGSHCVSCGETVVAQQVVPAKGHTLTVTFTHTANSQATATCSVCGYEFTADAQVTSETSGRTTTYTATVTIDNVPYTDIWTVTRPSDGGGSGGSGNTGGNSGGNSGDNSGGNAGNTPVEDPNVEDLDDPDTPLADKPFLFGDVKEDDWFYSDVKTVFNSSLMSGVSATSFQPFTDTTRAMVAQILYRMSGEPAVDGLDVTIADVPENAWYHDAAVWAYANGVFTGYEDGSFKGDVNVTREQLVTVLYRYAQKEGYDTSASADLSAYEDQSQTGAWAMDAMRWAVGSGLIQGRGANRVAPQEGAMRVELAVVLNRFVDKFVPATVLA